MEWNGVEWWSAGVELEWCGALNAARIVVGIAILNHSAGIVVALQFQNHSIILVEWEMHRQNSSHIYILPVYLN